MNPAREPGRGNGLAERLAGLETEGVRPDLADLDTRSTQQLVELIAAEDATVPTAVAAVGPAIVAAIDAAVHRMREGGRLIYVGAGTAGRLAVLDAAECVPTFGTPPELVQAILAGGSTAISQAVEGAEDDVAAGAQRLREAAVNERDVVAGVTASGRTPFVLGAIAHANAVGAFTIAITNNPGSELSKLVGVAIEPRTGPEVLAGSTRMKAGTAQKLVLNTLSTAVMIRLGKTYGNLMVDLRSTNEKLHLRARRILLETTGAHPDEVERALGESDGHVKTAMVLLLRGGTPQQARDRLQRAHGSVRMALSEEAQS